MKTFTRRTFLVTGASLPLAACASYSGIIKPLKTVNQIETEVRLAKKIMNSEIPGSIDLEKESNGMLLIPNISEANFWLGGAYGEGALFLGDAIVGYYNMAQASIGLKIGAQQYSHALFFMSPNSLKEFRSSDGWSLGADAEYVMAENSGWIGETAVKPAAEIVALIFNRSGATVGGSMEGTKYSPLYKN
tara:strand:- start:405 stop:974 length:570 start_codon:yes stop_codon:yes gene_type:complete